MSILHKPLPPESEAPTLTTAEYVAAATKLGVHAPSLPYLDADEYSEAVKSARAKLSAWLIPEENGG